MVGLHWFNMFYWLDGGYDRVCDLQLGRNNGVRPVADKKFYLRLPVDKMDAFTPFTYKYLGPYDCSRTSFTAAVNCTNPNTEIPTEIIEIEIIEAKI